MADAGSSASRSALASAIGAAAAIYCCARCVLSASSRAWGSRAAEAAAAKSGVALALGSLSVAGPTTSPLALTISLSDLRVELAGLLRALAPGASFSGGELAVGRIELCISPLAGSARLLASDVALELRPIAAGSSEAERQRLAERQILAERAARQRRYRSLDRAQADFWRRRAAGGGLSDSGEDDDDDEGDPLPEDEDFFGDRRARDVGSGVALLPRRGATPLDIAPPVRRGWLRYVVEMAVTRCLLGLLDRTEAQIKSLRVTVHSAPSEPSSSMTLSLHEASFGRAPHAADDSADRSAVRDPATAVPAHKGTLGRRSAWVRRDPLSSKLSLCPLPRSVWMRKTAVSQDVSLATIPERMQSWFPAAAEDRRREDQKKAPVAASERGPVSLLPSVHSLKVVGLSVQAGERLVLEQKMARVDVAACVDEHCWLRSLDVIVLDAFNVTTMPVEAARSGLPIFRGIMHGRRALRYAHQRHDGEASKRALGRWQFAFRCVQEQLRRSRPPAVLRWVKLSAMLDYQKRWLEFITQARGLGRSARPMLHTIQTITRETIARMAPSEVFAQHPTRSAKVLVTRTHADKWVKWLRRRRGTGCHGVALDLAQSVAQELAAAPDLTVHRWSRRRQLIQSIVELALLEAQPAAIGSGAADGGGYMLATEEILTLRVRAALENPDWGLPRVDIGRSVAECTVSLICREFHLSMHGMSVNSGVFVRVGDIGAAIRLNPEHVVHEFEFALGNVNAVQNITGDTLLGKAATRDFLRSEPDAAFVVLRSSLDVDSSNMHTAVRVSRLTAEAHLPALELLAAKASTGGGVATLDGMGIQAAESYVDLVEAVAPASHTDSSWLIPASDQAGVYLLQNRVSRSFEIDIDGPELAVTQADGSSLSVWLGTLDVRVTGSSAPATQISMAEHEAALRAALPRTFADGARSKLFTNVAASWSGFLASMSFQLGGRPMKIRFNQEFTWKAGVSSCVLPAQFCSLCGFPATTVRCDLAKIDFTVSPLEMTTIQEAASSAQRAIVEIVGCFAPPDADAQHEIPDELGVLANIDIVGPVPSAKADIPGPHAKPRGKRPDNAVRWDGTNGDWLDEDGQVTLLPPLDFDDRVAGMQAELAVDFPVLEIVVDPMPITFMLKQNRGRPLLLLALDFDNVHVWKGSQDTLCLHADLCLQAHFDNVSLATWEPVVEPWTSRLRLDFSRTRSALSFVSDKCLNVNLSPAFLQGLWGCTAPAPGGPEKAAIAEASPYWLRNSTGSSVAVRLQAGKDFSQDYLTVLSSESVALDAADYGAPPTIEEEGIALVDTGACDLHVRYQLGDREYDYKFVDVNRLDTHLPAGQLDGRPDLVCTVHMDSDGFKICEVCSRLKLENRTNARVEIGFLHSPVILSLAGHDSGYVPPMPATEQRQQQDFAVFVRPNQGFDWAEVLIEDTEVHRGVCHSSRIDMPSARYSACYSCVPVEPSSPVNVLTLFNALTLRNMLPDEVTFDIFSSAGETAADASCTLKFGESFAVPNWLPKQPAWVSVRNYRGSSSQRTLVHEAEVNKSYRADSFDAVADRKRRVGALRLTSRVQETTTLRLHGGQFSVKHSFKRKQIGTDHFGVALDHRDLVDEGHTVTIHVSHCVINKTLSPLYIQTDSKASFVVVDPCSSTEPTVPIMLPSSRKAKKGMVHKVRFGCPVQRVAPTDSSHRLMVVGAAYARDEDAFGRPLDLFAKVHCNSRPIGETEVIQSSRFPVWNKSVPVDIAGATAPVPVSIVLCDRRIIGPDSSLGEARIDASSLAVGIDLIFPFFTSSGRRRAVGPKRGVAGVWRSTSLDMQIDEYIILREEDDSSLTGSHLCGTGDAFAIRNGKHQDHEVRFEQVYEDGVRIEWVGSLNSEDSMVGTWHGAGVHGCFKAKRLRELDHADEAAGFVTVRLEEASAQDDVHFVGGWSKWLPVNVAMDGPIDSKTIEMHTGEQRQVGVCLEAPTLRCAPTLVVIVPPFVIHNLTGSELTLADPDSAWTASVQDGQHCEGFTAPRPSFDEVRLVLRKGQQESNAVDGLQLPGVKWGIFDSEDDTIHVYCRLNAQDTMVVTLRNSASVAPPYRILNCSMATLEYRAVLDSGQARPRYQELRHNTAAPLHEHMWGGSGTHKLEVRIGQEERTFLLERVTTYEDGFPKWSVETERGRVTLRPQVVVDRGSLSLRIGTTRVGNRSIDPEASKVEVLLRGGVGFSLISAARSRVTRRPDRRQELMYARVDDLCYKAYRSCGVHAMEFWARKFQLDDQVSQQVVMGPRLSNVKRQLHFSMVRSRTIVDKVDFNMLPIVFNLKFATAKRLYLWKQDILDERTLYQLGQDLLDERSLSPAEFTQHASEALSRLADPSYRSFCPDSKVDMPGRTYVKTIKMRRVQFECTVDMAGASGDADIGERMSNFVSSAGVSRLLLNISPYIEKDSFDTLEAIWLEMELFYKFHTKQQMFSLRGLGNLEVLGAPVARAKSVSESSREVALALRDGDAVGTALGTVNVAKEVVSGTLTSASHITSGVSGILKGVVAGPGSPPQQRESEKHVGKNFAEDLKDAVTGVVDRPREGLQQDGIEGLVRGVGEGVLGLALKPVAATLDLVSASTEGLSQALDANHLSGTGQTGRPTTLRNPRVFGQHGALREFSWGDVVLRQLASRRKLSPALARSGAEERCLDLLIIAPPMGAPSQSSRSTIRVAILTNTCFIYIAASVAYSVRGQVSADELLKMVRGVPTEEWEIVEDCDLEDLLEATLDVEHQAATLRMPGREVSLPCPSSGMPRLLSFMDSTVGAAHQRHKHTGVATDAQVQGSWLLCVTITETDADVGTTPQPRSTGSASRAVTQFEVELFHDDQGVLDSFRTVAESGALEVSSSLRDCRLRVRRGAVLCSSAPGRRRRRQPGESREGGALCSSPGSSSPDGSLAGKDEDMHSQTVRQRVFFVSVAPVLS